MKRPRCLQHRSQLSAERDGPPEKRFVSRPDSVNRRRGDMAFPSDQRTFSAGELAAIESRGFDADQQARAKDAARFLFRDTANHNIAVFSHDHLTERNAEHIADPLHFVQRLVADGKLSKQSEIIAKKLEAAGVDPYLSGEDRVSMVGLISGAVLSLSRYRNVNIIPEVAQRNRGPMIGAFELFLKERPEIATYARYMVVTSGRRFPIIDFPDRLKLFNDQLEDYWELCRERDIEPLLVAIEFTIDKEDGDSVNLHANIVTWPKRAFGSEGWAAWLQRTRQHFGDPKAGTKEAINRDSGVIRDVKEIIKYVTKPGDILGLSPEDTAFIAKSLYRRQLVRPLGVFKEWRRGVKDAGQKVRFDHTSKELVRCQVARRKRPEGEQPNEDEQRQDVFDEIEFARKEMRRQELARTGKLDDGPRDRIENQILCRTLPQARATLLAEPFVVVVNFTSDPSTENGRDGLAAIEARRRHHFKLLAEAGFTAEDMAAAGGSILDTRTLIPSAVARTYEALSPKRKAGLEYALDLDKDLLAQFGSTFVRHSVEHILERYMPRDVHEWSPDMANVEVLLREGLERQEEFEAKVETCRRYEREYEAYRKYRASLGGDVPPRLFDFDAEDFAIPY